jgi:transketolase
MDDRELILFAGEIRIAALECLAAFGSGHVGGAMSVVEALAALYGSELRHRPDEPGWRERDRLVLSKGHAGPALYAALSLRGFFPREWLATLNAGGTRLPSHVDRTKTPGVDMTCGSLGQGLSAAAGMALGARLNGRDSYTYAILGDGECDEGQVWEAAMLAAHYKLRNLIALVDCNKQQLDGYTRDILELGSLAEKFRSFGWRAIEVSGNDAPAVRGAIREAKREGAESGCPAVVVLDTVKGYGCPFAEGVANNHSMECRREDVDAAIAAIRERLAGLRGAAL